MIGTYLNTLAILVGTGIGCLLHGGIKPRYQEALYLAIGLAALGIGLENVVNNMQMSALIASSTATAKASWGAGCPPGSCFIASAPCRSSVR